MRVFKLIALTFLGAAAITIAAAYLYARRAPKLPSDNAFVFTKGRLWASIDGNNRTVALIDSGTSMSVFPKDWPNFSELEGGSERISTPFGQGVLRTRKVRPLKVGGNLFEGTVLIGDVSYPLIGSDFIFSKSNVLFARHGLEFDANYNPEEALACARLIISYQGNTIRTPVDSIHLLLKIDGAEQLVYFDTGRAATLEALASAPASVKKLFPRVDLRSNALGQSSLVPYFARHASLSLGGEQRSLFYRHYYTDRSLKAPFVMGAGILDEYSILFDTRKGRACFFKV